jgi:hypothetical protein
MTTIGDDPPEDYSYRILEWGGMLLHKTISSKWTSLFINLVPVELD